MFRLRSRSRLLAYALSLVMTLAASAAVYAGDSAGPLPK